MSIVHPATILVCGGTGSGKSVFTRNLIAENKKTFVGMPDNPRVVWCYGIYQPDFNVPITNTSCEYNEGLVDEDYLRKNRPDILVIDDLMVEKSNDPFVHNIFTKLSHHLKITVIFITQNLYEKGQCKMKRNAHYIVLMRSPSDKSFVHTLSRQLFPGSTKYFLESYADATSERFNYLLIDVSPTSDERLMLKTSILPDAQGIVQPLVYVKK